MNLHNLRISSIFSVVVLLISSQMVSGVVSQCESTFDALWLRHPGGYSQKADFVVK